MEVFRLIVLVSVVLVALWVIAITLTALWQLFFIWLNDQDDAFRRNPVLRAAKQRLNLDDADNIEVFLGGVVALLLWPISLVIVFVVIFALRAREIRRRRRLDIGAAGRAE